LCLSGVVFCPRASDREKAEFGARKTNARCFDETLYSSAAGTVCIGAGESAARVAGFGGASPSIGRRTVLIDAKAPTAGIGGLAWILEMISYAIAVAMALSCLPGRKQAVDKERQKPELI